SLDFGGREFSIKLAPWADQANGSVIVQYGDTVVLITCVMSAMLREGTDYFPLLVDYQERFYAAVTIKKSRFIKREGRPSDQATLTGRMIDRSIRPRFDMRMRNDVQVVATVLSFDKKNDPDIPSLIASSVALHLSDIPWRGPIGAVKVGRINKEYILNPTIQDSQNSDLLITLSGTKDKINMIEASAREIPENELLEAIEFGKKYIQKIIEFQEDIAKENATPKKEILLNDIDDVLKQEIERYLDNRLETVLFSPYGGSPAGGEAKTQRVGAVSELKEDLREFLKEKYPENKNNISLGLDFFEKKTDDIVHKNILESEKRVDGRKLDELRPVSCEVGVVPRVHGSGLFMRGNTHAFVSCTLGPPGDEQIIDEMEGE
ncbi:MAG: polyribonucleotide nucleotidyltransferase, partial [Deltaproteobacteria bacterium]